MKAARFDKVCGNESRGSNNAVIILIRRAKKSPSTMYLSRNLAKERCKSASQQRRSATPTSCKASDLTTGVL
jgi:hypothetical protein